MKKPVVFLVAFIAAFLVAFFYWRSQQPAPPGSTSPPNPDIGAKGGATQVDTETH